MTDPQIQIEQAAKAALEISRKFAQRSVLPSHALSGFACGVGLAHGTAIAGRIGAPDQYKIGVFGPAVNLAARLESMTKQFQVRILVDEAVAKAIQSNRRGPRCRTIAKVRPVGLSPLQVSELLLPADEVGAMKEPTRLDYESAYRFFLDGRWDKTKKLLPFADGPSERLKQFMAQHANGPPPNWDGVIPLTEK
jgi:adenylate cyclase